MIVDRLILKLNLQYDNRGIKQLRRDLQMLTLRANRFGRAMHTAMGPKGMASSFRSTNRAIAGTRKQVRSATRDFRQLGRQVNNKRTGLSAFFMGSGRPSTRRGRGVMGRGTQFLSGMGQGLGFGAGLGGFNLVAHSIGRAVRGATSFHGEIQQTKIGLASVISAVDSIPFDQARTKAQGLFDKIQIDAIRTTATTKELFNVFQAIAGPLKNIGRSYKDVRRITLDTVNAANALNIDLPQASRDIRMMVEGRAGTRVRLFAQLRSMGLLEDAPDVFNQLSPEERVAKLEAALKKAGVGADAFAKSWRGITSTLQDIGEIFSNELVAPILDMANLHLRRLAEYLIENQKRIRASLKKTGQSIASFVGKTVELFDSLFLKTKMLSAMLASAFFMKQAPVFIKILTRALALVRRFGLMRVVLAGASRYLLVMLLPFLKVIAAFTALSLILDDIFVFLSGGRSVTGDLIEQMFGKGSAQKTLKEIKGLLASLGVEGISLKSIFRTFAFVTLGGLIAILNVVFLLVKGFKLLGTAIGETLAKNMTDEWQEWFLAQANAFGGKFGPSIKSGTMQLGETRGLPERRREGVDESLTKVEIPIHIFGVTSTPDMERAARKGAERGVVGLHSVLRDTSTNFGTR